MKKQFYYILIFISLYWIFSIFINKLPLKEFYKNKIVMEARKWHEGKNPNYKKALFYYKKAAYLGDIQSLFDYATIIGFGGNNIKEDPKTAKYIFENIKNSNNDFWSTLADEKIALLNNNIYNNENINTTITGFNQDNFFQNIRNAQERTAQERQNENEFRNQEEAAQTFIRLIQPRINNIQNNNNNEIRNDPQNVHDTTVVQSSKNSLNNLEKSTLITIPIHQTLIDIRKKINNVKDPKKRSDATKTLDTMEQTNSHISSINKNELDVVNIIWNRINSNVHNNKEDLKDNLINELASAVENNNVVCSQGRYNRVIDSINHIDPDVNIQPRWSLNQTMMNKASKIRNDMEKNTNNETKEALKANNPTEEQTKLTEKFDLDFKLKLMEDFEKEYVDTKLISKEHLKSQINSWF